ncbi:hypothetical protein SY89_02423 [Halolamina pelagica]|uniref:Acyl-CoA dehydrogenase n=1 Tax=Halolamina pelagica TaxID=699431 RepID=A0A0P7HX59_9EURY|nr:hypothetical protein SY89_02423 [Halolamina pelagica]
MDFGLNAEQRQIRDTVAEFVDEEVVPAPPRSTTLTTTPTIWSTRWPIWG